MNSLDTRTTGKGRERRASAPARKRTVDARSKHPAVLLVKGVTGRNPPKALYDKVIAIAGDTPDGERAALVSSVDEAIEVVTGSIRRYASNRTGV